MEILYIECGYYPYYTDSIHNVADPLLRNEECSISRPRWQRWLGRCARPQVVCVVCSPMGLISLNITGISFILATCRTCPFYTKLKMKPNLRTSFVQICQQFL